MKDIVVRRALPEDKAPILGFCQTTFSWGDYIGLVWDDWFADPDGQILVGLVDDEPVGMVHVAILENGVGWMEGMRVHPDYRRHGIGTAVDAGGRGFAWSRGCRFARLATSMKNIPAQNALGPQGYHRTGVYHEWIAPPLDDHAPEATVSSLRDVDHILELWNRSEVRKSGSDLLPDPHWRWTGLSPKRCRSQVDAGEIRRLRHGFSIMVAHENEMEIHLHALVSGREVARELALDARREAAFRGYEAVEAMLEDLPNLNLAVGTAGFKREGGMLIYEQEF